METQEISAPADGLTAETAKRRQVGYGLPCAKCHKYFPADLELCPICKGRERVSPVVAPKIPKPVKSETSVAPASTKVALKQEVKESPKSESPALAPPIEIKAKDQPLDHKESMTIPAVAQTQAAIEPAHASLALTQTVLMKEEKESPKLESSAVAPPVEINEDQVSITIPAIAEIQATVEPALADRVSTQKAEESPQSESPAVECLIDRPNNDQFGQEEHFAIPAFVEAQASAPVPTAIVPMRKEEEERTPELDAPAFAVPMHAAVADQYLTDQHLADQRLADQRRDRINEALRIVIPMLLEDQASRPESIGLVSEHRVGELPSELESPAVDFPIRIAAEESHKDPIVIPALIETQASKSAPVGAERRMEQKKKAEAPEMLETPKSSSEVRVADVKITDVRIAEVKIVESPAVFDHANHPAGEEKSRAIDGSDAPPKPIEVNAPATVYVSLGELRAPKGTLERLPAPEQFKEIKSTQPEISSSEISPDIYASKSPAPVSSRRFDLMTFALSVVVLACAVLLITLAVLRLMPHHASPPVHRAKAAYSSTPATADQNANVLIPTPPPMAAVPENSSSSDSSPVVAPAVPAQPPAASASNPSSSASAEQVLTLSPDLAEGNLLYRVEPDYPEDARRQGAQGPVVLDLHIGKDGLVQGVSLVSGQPLLAQAASAAVKQWRFRTRYVNGYATEMQARITLHFALPTL